MKKFKKIESYEKQKLGNIESYERKIRKNFLWKNKKKFNHPKNKN